MLSVLILTKNEEQDLSGCLDSVSWSDDIQVYDSFSTDKTIEIAEKAGAKITKRIFDNWASHQNWGLRNIKFKYPWVLYIDADERVSNSLLDSLKQVDLNNHVIAAYEIQRRDYAWDGRWLKHAQISPFYIRLFRPEKIQYERLVNPVTHVNGRLARIEGYLNHYPFSKGIDFWIQRHLKYATAEAQIWIDNYKEGKKFSLKKALFSKDFSERRYHQKGIYYKFPGRPLIKFFYMMFIRLSFLDGRAGVTYATLQSIYEYFIVIKTRELLKNKV